MMKSVLFLVLLTGFLATEAFKLHKLVPGIVACALLNGNVIKTNAVDDIPNVPLYTKRSNDLQAYSDIARGFKLLRFIYTQLFLFIFHTYLLTPLKTIWI